MFRYRTLKSLFDYSELENHNVYFSDIEEDKHEGDINFYWRGDKIAWRNLISHFYWTFSSLIALGTENPYRKGMYAESSFSLFGKKYNVQRMGLESLLNRKVISNFLNDINEEVTINIFELKLFLMIIVPTSISEYIAYENSFDHNAINLKAHENKKNVENIVRVFKEANEDTLEHLYTMLQFHWSSDVDKIFKGRSSEFKQIMATFPSNYIDTICKIVSPDIYIASFSKIPTDEVMWARYAESNTGVCLEFNSDKELMLNAPYEFSINDRKYKYRAFPYREVDYDSQPKSLNFFENMGSIRNGLLQDFLKDENGQLSICYQNMHKDIEGWRKHYWGTWLDAYNRKMKNWSFEKEYRLILLEFMGVYQEKKDRILEYNMHDLKSITFGEKMPDNDKKKIVGIMEKKLGSAFENFTFYQQGTNLKGQITRIRL